MGLFKRSAPSSGTDFSRSVPPSPWRAIDEPETAHNLAGRFDAPGLAADTVHWIILTSAIAAWGSWIRVYFYARRGGRGYAVGRTIIYYTSGYWEYITHCCGTGLYTTPADANDAARQLAEAVARGKRDVDLPFPQWDGEPW